MECPAGHKLPRQGQFGQCTPMYCGDTNNVVDLAVVGENHLTPLAADEDAEVELETALKRERARHKLTKPPRGLKGAQAEEYVTEKLAELSVLAIHEQEAQLRFGDPAARGRTAKEILAATGHGPKEGGGAPGALIVINANGEQSTLPPWRRKKGQVVESTAKVVEPDDDEEDK